MSVHVFGFRAGGFRVSVACVRARRAGVWESRECVLACGQICECVCERERERVCVCVCVCARARALRACIWVYCGDVRRCSYALI